MIGMLWKFWAMGLYWTFWLVFMLGLEYMAGRLRLWHDHLNTGFMEAMNWAEAHLNPEIHFNSCTPQGPKDPLQMFWTPLCAYRSKLFRQQGRPIQYLKIVAELCMCSGLFLNPILKSQTPLLCHILIGVSFSFDQSQYHYVSLAAKALVPQTFQAWQDILN